MIDPALPLLEETFKQPTISSLSKFGIQGYRNSQSGWQIPGFFAGDATCLDDLICYWNLRAADIPLLFVDGKHSQRFTRLIPAWDRLLREQVSYRQSAFERQVAVWRRRENSEDLKKLFGDLELLQRSVSEDSWEGTELQPPTMYFSKVSTLGVMGQDKSGKTKVSFALNDKPFSTETWLWTQHLVVSVSSITGLWGDEQHTLRPLFIPELNEFYSRQMFFEYDKMRVEPEGVGLIVDVTETDSFLYALSVFELTEKVFGIAGFATRFSPAGLMARQLVSQVGGLQGGRVFKIPGVRRLLKTHGINDWFAKNDALGLIAGKDPENSNAKFEDHKDLYIKGHQIGADPKAVFTYLVEKGLLRMGVELICPSCSMTSWTAVDLLKQREVVCDLCGEEYDATTQLVNTGWRYRRSGVLGRERNVQGAICVALTLQQLRSNLSETFGMNIYSPSLELKPLNGGCLPECEIDFVRFSTQPFAKKTVVILGECKGQAPVKATEFQKDADNLRRVADALPVHRFNTFILFAKLSNFTPDEIGVVKALNDEQRHRVILLTDRELEPYRIYERTKHEYQIDEHANTPQRLADNTAKVFFRMPDENPN